MSSRDSQVILDLILFSTNFKVWDYFKVCHKEEKVCLSQHVPVACDDVVGGDVDADGEDGDANADPQNDHDHDERLVRGARIWRNGQRRTIS